MENLYNVIKSAIPDLPDPKTYDKDDATIEVEYNGSRYLVTYHRRIITDGESKKYTWGFDTGGSPN